MSWAHEITAINADKHNHRPLIDESLQKNAKKINEIITRIRERARAANQNPQHTNKNKQREQQRTKSKTDSSAKIFIISINPERLTTEYCKKASAASSTFGCNAYFFFDKNTNNHYRKITTPLAIELSLGKQGLDECVDNIIQAVEKHYKNTDAITYLQAMLCIAYLARSGLLRGEFSADDLLPTKQNDPQKTCIFVPDQDRATLEFVLGQQNLKYETFTVDGLLGNNRATNLCITQQPVAAVIPKVNQLSSYTTSNTYLSTAHAIPSSGKDHRAMYTQRA